MHKPKAKLQCFTARKGTYVICCICNTVNKKSVA